MIIYKIDDNGYYGGAIEVSDDLVGIPFGTTRTPIPETIQENEYLKWVGTGWETTTVPPPPISIAIVEPEPTTEVLVSKSSIEQKLAEQYNLTPEQIEALFNEAVIGE